MYAKTKLTRGGLWWLILYVDLTRPWYQIPGQVAICTLLWRDCLDELNIEICKLCLRQTILHNVHEPHLIIWRPWRKRLKDPEEEEFLSPDWLWTQAAAWTLPWHPGLPFWHANLGLVYPQNHMNQFFKMWPMAISPWTCPILSKMCPLSPSQLTEKKATL